MGALGVVAVSCISRMLGIIPSEIIGTALLILLGDGVVAAVLLTKSKARELGLDRHHLRVGHGGDVRRVRRRVLHRRASEPGGDAGFWIHGTIDGAQAIKYLIGEFIGAMVGAVLVFLAYYLHWSETEDPGLKLAVFSTGPAIRNYAWNLVTEIIGTFVLVFGVLSIIAPWNTVLPGADLAPLLIGLLVFAIGLSLGGPTGYAINPARDLGPRIMHAILPIPGKGGSDWAYCVGAGARAAHRRRARRDLLRRRLRQLPL